ncbi:putative competence-related protein [Escherichia coli]|uniref:Putative competence-related protein n=1 Tax=Escherichia coli TaxID=562 RepID=A0A377K8T3_ECOLX|nr:putative competence-related protein [Escherichia coli]
MKITTVGVCIICGIFPLLILPQLPGTVTLAFLTLFACVLAFIPVKTVRYIVLTLLFFVWGHISSKANFVGRRNLNWRDAGCNC